MLMLLRLVAPLGDKRTQCDWAYSEKSKTQKRMRDLGVEPRMVRPQRTVLTTILITHFGPSRDLNPGPPPP